jgi:DNA-binding NarL/FixJ family response regulator
VDKTDSHSKSLRIAIIEDDPLMQLGLQHALNRHPQDEMSTEPKVA